MNRFVSKIAVVLTVFVLIAGHAKAQFTTTFAKNVTPGQQNGLYYSLPQTMLKLDFIIEETQMERSPLSDYASNYMEMADYVDYESTEYRLVDVKMSSIATPDPNALFFVTFGAVRGSNKIQFDLLPNGIIRCVGMGNGNEDVMDVVEYEISTPFVESNGSSNTGLMNLMTSGKSNAQLAKEVADKIEEIRKAKFNLVSGYYETAFNPEALKMMYQELEKMEAEYTNLLLGNRISKTVVKSVYRRNRPVFRLEAWATGMAHMRLQTGTVEHSRLSRSRRGQLP